MGRPEDPTSSITFLASNILLLKDSKRKAADQRLSHSPQPPKRARRDNSESEFELESESELESEPESEPETEADFEVSTSGNSPRDISTQRRIQFDEVYQDGDARYKHLIIEYDAKWYIIVCEEHNKHFGDNPLRGAAKHLCSKAHDNDQRTYARAIEKFGIEVLDCDPRRQMINNDAFRVALHEGYQPLNNPQMPSRREPAAHVRSRDRRNIIDAGISSPVPGDIYLTHVQTTHNLVGVIALPRNCFGDRSFEEVGLEGSSTDGTSLLENVPDCYRTSPPTGRITGWEKGYEDGGLRAYRRLYPVMYLDSEPASGRVAWLRATSLRVYDQESWAGKPELISNYARLRRFENRRQRLRAAATRQAGTARSDEYTPGTTDPESPHQSASPPVAPCEETTERPSESRRRLVSGTDKQRSLESNGQSGSPEPSASSESVSRRNVPFATSGFQPIESDVVGHATTLGEELPQHNQAQESRGSSGNELGRLGTGARRGATSSALRRSYETIASARPRAIRSTGGAVPRWEKEKQRAAAKEAHAAAPQEPTATTPKPLTDSTRNGVTSNRRLTGKASTRHQGSPTSMGPLPVVRSNNPTSRAARDQLRSHGTEDSPVDIDEMERDSTATTSNPLRRSSGHRVPTARDTSATQQRRLMPSERQVGREQEPSFGATESNDRDRQPMSPRAR